MRDRGGPAGSMSAFAVYWELFLRAKNEVKARRILARVEGKLQVPLPTMECVPHENGDLYRARFSTPLDVEAGDYGKAIYQALLLADALGRGWYVYRPRLWEDGSFWFEGHRATGGQGFSVSGIDSASFSVTNDVELEERSNNDHEGTAERRA